MSKNMLPGPYCALVFVDGPPFTTKKLGKP